MALPRTSRDLARLCARLAFDKKAERIVLLDLRKLSAPADFYVVATATSAPHLEALARHLRDELKNQGVRTLRIDGGEGSEWTVVDLFDVMVHFFTEAKRGFYDLEDLYSDAPAEDFDGETLAVKKTEKKEAALKRPVRKIPAGRRSPKPKPRSGRK